MEARQKWPLVLRAVDESVAHVTHRRPDDGEGDPAAVISNLGGRLEEVAETLIPQRPGRPLHVLHLETHVTHCVHRVVSMGSVQTFQVPVVSGRGRTPATWRMFIQPPQRLVRPLVDQEHGRSPAERELLRSVRQSGREHIKLEPGNELMSNFFHV